MVPMQKFVEQVLAPERLTVTDLQNFLRDELVVQQMIQTLGLAGALVTPQEAGLLYDREYQEVSAQAVFFSAVQLSCPGIRSRPPPSRSFTRTTWPPTANRIACR